MRIGLFGGSFDPVHYGHLLLAELCREQASLDEIWFCPTSTSPHKEQVFAGPEDRFEMLRLATAGHEPFRVRREEIDRGGVSYTVDTLRESQAKYPGNEWFFLLGADMLYDLPRWKEAEAVCRLAVPVCAERRGCDPIRFDHLRAIASEERIALFQRHRVVMPTIELSGTEIRRRIADGLSIRFQTPSAVEEYIRAGGLYR